MHGFWTVSELLCDLFQVQDSDINPGYKENIQTCHQQSPRRAVGPDSAADSSPSGYWWLWCRTQASRCWTNESFWSPGETSQHLWRCEGKMAKRINFEWLNLYKSRDKNTRAHRRCLTNIPKPSGQIVLSSWTNENCVCTSILNSWNVTQKQTRCFSGGISAKSKSF